MASGQIKLTGDQQRAFEIIMRGDDTFITGGAGTGKSVLIKEAICALEKQNKSVVICAPTGIAAVNIGGTTIHKAFGFPKGPCITEKTHRLTVRTPKLIRMADVILIDEVSMCRMDMMDAVCSSVIKVREETGRHIQMVVAGDFCQLPPVTVDGSGEREILEDFYGMDVGLAFAFQAPGWKMMGFTNVELCETVRQQDEDFIHYLNILRRGGRSALRYFNTFASFEDDPNATRLCSRNEDVDRLNEKELGRLKGEMVTFQPYYMGPASEMIYSGQPVSLKVGAKVIVTTNQAMPVSMEKGKDRGINNGAIGTVIDIGSYPDDFENDYVIVSVRGRSYCIYRKTDDIYSHYMGADGKIHRMAVGNVSYMPVKPGYAMTIHRSQGQTFDSVVLDPSCWTSGQLYVALSRLRSIDGLHLTKNISIRDICLAPVVEEFYQHLHDDGYGPAWQRSAEEATAPQNEPYKPRSKVLSFPAMNTSRPLEQERSIVSEVQPLTIEEASVESAGIPDTPVMQVIPEKQETAFQQEKEPAASSPVTVTEERDRAVSSPAPADKDTGGKDPAVKKPRGRPVRYTNKSKVCRIPVELEEEVRAMLQIVCPKGGINEKALVRFKTALRKLCEK